MMSYFGNFLASTRLPLPICFTFFPNYQCKQFSCKLFDRIRLIIFKMWVTMRRLKASSKTYNSLLEYELTEGRTKEKRIQTNYYV